MRRDVARALLCLSLALLTSTPERAEAQTGGQFALGLNVAALLTPDKGTTGQLSPSPLWRFGHGRDGWGWQFGLGWYSADLTQPLGDARAGFGELHVRPVLGGYGYSRRSGPLLATARLLTGYSFNSFTMLPAYDDRYRSAIGAASLTSTVSNTLVLRPELSVWADLGRKVGMNITVGYTVTRPTVTVESLLGRDARHIHADAFTLSVGAVYSLF